MVIKSKFKSECPLCHDKIETGEIIEWFKGKPAQHYKCFINILLNKNKQAQGGSYESMHCTS